MERLPPELLEHIFCDSIKQDILSLRLVSRNLAAALAPLAFKDFSLYCFTWCLDRLRSIAASPYSHHVTRIVVYTEKLRVVEEDAFQQAICNAWSSIMRRPGEAEGCWLPETEWTQAWQTYSQYLATQTDFLKDASHQKALLEAFAALPRLRQVSIQRFDRDDRAPQDELAPWILCSSYSVILARQMTQILQFGRGGEDRRATAWILEAIGQRARLQPISHVRQLYIDVDLDEPSLLTAENLHSSSPDKLQDQRTAVLEGLSHLTTLTVWTPYQFEYGLWPTQATLLASCTQVCVVKLHRFDACIACWLRDVERPRSFTFATPPTLWPQLASLDLEMVHIDSSDLTEFMLQHSKSLKWLKICRCWLNDVKAVLYRLPEVHSLQRIYLCGLSEPKSLVWPGTKCMVYFPFGSDVDADFRLWSETGRGDPFEKQPVLCTTEEMTDIKDCFQEGEELHVGEVR